MIISCLWSGHESCLYVRREGGAELMVAVYVDDLVVSGSSPALVSGFKQSLASKYDLTDQGGADSNPRYQGCSGQAEQVLLSLPNLFH